MTNVIPFDSGRPPAIFQNRRTTMNQAAQQGVQASFAVIGYKGRNWRIKYRGEEELLKGSNGAPLPTLEVVVVGVSPSVSKQWFERKFSETTSDGVPPDCFSLDGVSPDASSPKKQCGACAVCPKNAWGSAVSDEGKKGKACQDRRRIAVVPLGDLANETYGGPMLLSMPPTSLNNLAAYAGLLERKGASLEFVGTRLGFDYDVAYPKITFEPIGWLTQEQAVEVIGPDGNGGICAEQVIEQMLQHVSDVAVAEAPPAEAEPESPLDQGAPAQVAVQQRLVAEAIAKPAPAPAPQAEPAPAPAAPPKRQRAASAFQAAPVIHENSTSPITTLAPTPTAPPTVVAEAPQDMQSAIDELLNSA